MVHRPVCTDGNLCSYPRNSRSARWIPMTSSLVIPPSPAVPTSGASEGIASNLDITCTHKSNRGSTDAHNEMVLSVDNFHGIYAYT